VVVAAPIEGCTSDIANSDGRAAGGSGADVDELAVGAAGDVRDERGVRQHRELAAERQEHREACAPPHLGGGPLDAP